MPNLPTVTIEARVVADPELRFTPNGKAVTSLRVVAQDRRQNPQTSEWEDAGEPLWLTVNVWERLGENVAESITKGDEVIVIGKLGTRTWQDKEGNARTSTEIRAFNVAPSLKFRKATLVKTGAGEPGNPQAARTAARVPADDPWGTPSGPVDDNPPF